MYLSIAVSDVRIQDLLQADGQAQSVGDISGQRCHTATTTKHQTVVVLSRHHCQCCVQGGGISVDTFLKDCGVLVA